jgi:uronate dehydrogenase
VKHILITGAAGAIGKVLRAAYGGKYLLRLSDIAPLGEAAPGEELMNADVADLTACERLMQGVDCVVHLGAVPVEDAWEKILPANIAGCYNVFEAARRAGVKRVIFASSNHAVGFHRRERFIDNTVQPRPDTRYGVSKVFGEALGSLYADKYGMEIFCMRIGNVNPVPIDKRRLSILFTPRDLAQLVTIGIEHPAIRFEIVYGVSKNKRSWYDNANAYRLGYQPQDDSEKWAAEVLAREKPGGDPEAELYQGGVFCVAEEIPNPAPLPRKKRKQ